MATTTTTRTAFRGAESSAGCGHDHPPRPLHVLEFFCGIGGLWLALKGAAEKWNEESRATGGAPLWEPRLVKAFDVNNNACGVYLHNFGETPVSKNVEHLRLSDVDGCADVWLLSPPCQPFTRGGLKKDVRDRRSDGLCHLMSLLRECKSPPKLLFLENVRGFEKSNARRLLHDSLATSGFVSQEFIVSPTQLGLPNSRVRFFAVAVGRDGVNDEGLGREWGGGEGMASSTIQTGFPSRSVDAFFGAARPLPTRLVGDFLEIDGVKEVDEAELRIDEACRKRMGQTFRHDVATPSSTITSTFTKGYFGSHSSKTGSVLDTKSLAAFKEASLQSSGPLEGGERHGRRAEDDAASKDPCTAALVAGQRHGRWAGRNGRETLEKDCVSPRRFAKGGGRLEGGPGICDAVAAPAAGGGAYRGPSGVDKLAAATRRHSDDGDAEKGIASAESAEDGAVEETTPVMPSPPSERRQPQEPGRRVAELPSVLRSSPETDGGNDEGREGRAEARTGKEDLAGNGEGDDLLHVRDTQLLEPQRFRLLAEREEGLRFFSPRELLRLHGFPESFHFPPSLSIRQQHELIGNSISVQSAKTLLHHGLGLLRQQFPSASSNVRESAAEAGVLSREREKAAEVQVLPPPPPPSPSPKVASSASDLLSEGDTVR